MKNKLNFIIITLDLLRNLKIDLFPFALSIARSAMYRRVNDNCVHGFDTFAAQTLTTNGLSKRIILGFGISLLLFSTQLISSESGPESDIQTEQIIARHIADPETTERVESSTKARPYEELTKAYNIALDAVEKYVRSGGKGKFPIKSFSEFNRLYRPHKDSILDDYFHPNPETPNANAQIKTALYQHEMLSDLERINQEHDGKPKYYGGRGFLEEILNTLHDKFKNFKYKLASGLNTFTNRRFNSRKMDEIEDLANAINRDISITKQPKNFSKDYISQLLNRQNRIETRAKVLQKISTSSNDITEQIEAAVKEGILGEAFTERPETAEKSYGVVGTGAGIQVRMTPATADQPSAKAELVFNDDTGKEQRTNLTDINSLSQTIIDRNLDVLGDH